ncbi:UPF0182 family protein [Nocardioides sp. SYSU D00038]|uniref:UPF0182 family membrane protein n=1 Tax=Nocardioides sp. SYSU D00038 TaxID=2812554 RepID=UPI00196833BC|nr:UPF0182 family protein [Nocardioides sp. SYSU D00038]
MSELFDDDPRDEAPARSSRRSRALIITAGVLVVAFFLLTTFASFYTDRLWYSATGYASVFNTLFWTRVLLFLVFGVLMGVVVSANIVIAYRLRPLFHPQSPEQSGLDRYREAVTPVRTWLVVGIGLLLAVFAGTSGTGEWRNFLLWRNGVDFGQDDQHFGRDIGFFVFDLPWFHYLVDFTMALAVISLIAAALVHYLYGGIRLQSPGDRLSGAAQAQLSVLLGVFVLAKAVDYWLDRFDLASQSGSLIDGIKFTDDNAVLPAKNILMGIALICAVLFFLNVWRRTWLLSSMGLALLALSAVLLGLIWPAIVQSVQVRPSEADKEEPYIAKNIEATRQAYDLEDVEVTEFSPDRTDPENTPALQTKLSSVPLVDPQLVRRTFEQNQQLKSYYTVADVLDVDHYEIGGNDRALVLGVRELNQSGIPDADRNWSNLHTVYTHGNGIIAAFANQRNAENSATSTAGGGTEDDRTQWAEGNGANENDLGEAVGSYESRIYYGEGSPDYSVVGKADADSRDVELDLGRTPIDTEGGDDDSTEDTEATTFDGDGGVEVGSTFRKLLYAIRFGEPNFLLSGRVNDNSQVLYHRTPRERVEKVAPWLSIDSDAYPVIVDGRIQWVLDGYTTTDRYPGAERESFETMTDDALQDETGLRTLPTDEINYMRNAVKATVDAYDGSVKIYAWDEEDPLLQAWRSAFPDVVEPRSEIPDELLEHLRYPEDLFKVQRYQYARYHVTDAEDFYAANNRWEVPVDPNSEDHLQPPYRMFVDQDGTETWSLTSTFVPYRRNNLAAYVSVDSDATQDSYGTMRVLEVSGEQIEGPGQVANTLTADTDVTERLAPFRLNGRVTYGNLLTIPIDDRLMYVEPVYASRSTTDSAYPILRYVLVSFNDKVGIGTTLVEAIGDAIGEDISEPDPQPEPGGEPDPGGEPEPEPGTPEQRIRDLLNEAQEHFDEADAALAEGDLAGYQAAIEDAEAALAEALDLADARDGGGESGDGAAAEPTDAARPEGE